ncbi:hypothetical protein SAMN04487967_1334 [Natronorubrum sediminis]|uniref:Uncharacterized protein n=1 Tax=Natronorubrum sediminis TaxID=640943 RepID=A0A1H6FSY3_9EURY|nr:hypothetical protein SAMN04487967_1334 [Natronorubrum sediminis]
MKLFEWLESSYVRSASAKNDSESRSLATVDSSQRDIDTTTVCHRNLVLTSQLDSLTHSRFASVGA